MKQSETDHLTGKHNNKYDNLDVMKQRAQDNPDCGFCARKVVRVTKKHKKAVLHHEKRVTETA